MLPGKIFLQSIKIDGDRNIANKTAFKLNLVFNDIYYDELKQFHTKYICISSLDVLKIELVAAQSQQLLGTSVIPEVYKHLIDNQTVQVKTKCRDLSSQYDITIKLSFQTLSTFNRTKRSASNTKRAAQDTILKSPNKQKDPSAIERQMSFSNNRDFFNETLGNTSRNSLLGTSRLPLQPNFLKDGQGQSLESLAQQRQKILGQLFGKFKREK